MPEGLENYASPILRMGVFMRLFPGATIEFEVVPIEQAFASGFRQASKGCPQPPTEAVVCTIFLPSGAWFEAAREIDRYEYVKREWREIEMTPETYAKFQTKAQGRCLTTAGIPMKMSELQTLMRFHVADARQPVQTDRLRTEEAVRHVPSPVDSDSPEDDDSPDAGAEDEPTPLAVLLARLDNLAGHHKAIVTRQAREQYGIANVARLREQDDIDHVNQIIDALPSAPTQEEAP